MPTIRKSTAFGVGGTGSPATPFSGDQYEFLPFAAKIAIAIVAKGAAADTALITATVFSGSDILQMNGPVTQKLAGSTVTNPDDYMLDDVAAQGDRLNVQLIAGNLAAAVTVETVCMITPLS